MLPFINANALDMMSKLARHLVQGRKSKHSEYTKKKYDFNKIKRNRKIAKASKKRNRRC